MITRTLPVTIKFSPPHPGVVQTALDLSELSIGETNVLPCCREFSLSAKSGGLVEVQLTLMTTRVEVEGLLAPNVTLNLVDIQEYIDKQKAEAAKSDQ